MCRAVRNRTAPTFSQAYAHAHTHASAACFYLVCPQTYTGMHASCTQAVVHTFLVSRLTAFIGDAHIHLYCIHVCTLIFHYRDRVVKLLFQESCHRGNCGSHSAGGLHGRGEPASSSKCSYSVSRSVCLRNKILLSRTAALLRSKSLGGTVNARLLP